MQQTFIKIPQLYIAISLSLSLSPSLSLSLSLSPSLSLSRLASLDDFNHLQAHLHTANSMVRSKVIKPRYTVVAISKDLNTQTVIGLQCIIYYYILK